MTKRYDRPLTAEELASRPDDEIDTSDIPSSTRRSGRGPR